MDRHKQCRAEYQAYRELGLIPGQSEGVTVVVVGACAFDAVSAVQGAAKDQKMVTTTTSKEKRSNFSFFPRKNVTGCILGLAG